MYRRLFRALSVTVLVIAIAGLSAPGLASTRALTPGPATPTTEQLICQMESPNPTSGYINTLSDIAAIGRSPDTSDGPGFGPVLWAVGQTGGSPMGGFLRTMTMRYLYQGKGWEVVPSPNLPGDNYLTAVTARTAWDVWAVGYAYTNYGMELPLMMHFNGVDWQMAPEPSPVSNAIAASLPFNFGRLTDVAVLATSDVEVVAVGYKYGHLIGSQPVVLYFNGENWKGLDTSTLPQWGKLTSIAGSSFNDLWATMAVGEESILYHFDGLNWTVMSRTLGNLTSVALAGETVFAVGDVAVGKNTETLAIRYDRLKGFTDRIKTYNRDVDHNYLTSVVADGSKVYAIGYTGIAGNQLEMNTLVLKYDGQIFAPLDSPNPTGIDRLAGATIVDGILWAVGDSQIWYRADAPGPGNFTLVLTTACNN